MKKTSLKLAFDASPLTGMKTGVYQYVRNVCLSLASINRSIQINLFLGNRWISQQDYAVGQGYDGHWARLVSRISDNLGEKVKLIRKKLNYRNQNRILKNGIKLYRPDIVHFTQNYFNVEDLPTVFTIYDLSCFRFPETHPRSRVLWYEQHLPFAIENASHIISISEFSKSELIKYFGITPNKVSAIPCGVSAEFYPLTDDEVSRTIGKYNLENKRYLLSIGTLEPRKNLDSIIHAYSRLPDNHSKNFKLVIIGAQGWDQDGFTNKHENLIRSGKLILPGFVPQADLPAFISGAKLSLYPSLYEGFGLPVLESMACGTPVVASNTSSIPEILVDKDVLIDPYNIDHWTECITRIIEDINFENKLSRAGLERSRLFSWEKGIEKMITIYENLLNECS